MPGVTTPESAIAISSATDPWGRPYAIGFDPGGIALYAWVPELGWALPGKSWLMLYASGIDAGSQQIGADQTSSDRTPTLSVDLQSSLRVSTGTSDGVPPAVDLPVIADLIGYTNASWDGIFFEVPIDAPQLELTFTPTPPPGADGDAIGTWSPGTLTIEFL